MSTRASGLLLRVRALQELLARRDVAQAAQEQRTAEQEAGDAELALASLLMPTVAATPQFLAVAAAQRSGAVLVAAQHSLATAAAERTATARAAWLEAEARRTSVEHLDDALRDRERLDRGRAEQRATDDLVSARHGRTDNAGRADSADRADRPRSTADTTTHPEDAR